MPGPDVAERPFKEACCLCGKQVAGRRVPAAEAGAFAQEDLAGYLCVSCGMTYCQSCALKHVFRILGHSVCKSCGASVKEADYVVDSRPPLLQARGTVTEVEASDYGGATHDEPVLVCLFDDRLRLTKQGGAPGPRMSTEIELGKVSEVKLRPPSGKGKKGSLVVCVGKHGVLRALLAGNHEVTFDPADMPAFESLAERLRAGPAVPVSPPAAAAPPPSPPAQQAPPPPSSAALTDLEMIEKLADLREKGVITEEEFAAKKKQMLGL